MFFDKQFLHTRGNLCLVIGIFWIIDGRQKILCVCAQQPKKRGGPMKHIAILCLILSAFWTSYCKPKKDPELDKGALKLADECCERMDSVTSVLKQYNQGLSALKKLSRKEQGKRFEIFRKGYGKTRNLVRHAMRKCHNVRRAFARDLAKGMLKEGYFRKLNRKEQEFKTKHRRFVTVAEKYDALIRHFRHKFLKVEPAGNL